jgi:putative hydrolase of HD superfamily
MAQEVDSLLALLRHGNQLKRTARTGWVQRGVPNAENVAAHSFGVAYTALMLAESMDEEVDMGRLLSMALLHDLPEAVTSDIPTPSWRFLPPGSKAEVEAAALKEIFAKSVPGDRGFDLWKELQAAESLESRIVHDADRIDMYLQATVYAEQTGNLLLEEFWNAKPSFNLSVSQQIYDVLAVQSDKALRRQGQMR